MTCVSAGMRIEADGVIAGPFADAAQTASAVKALRGSPYGEGAIIALLAKGEDTRGRFLCFASGADECLQLDWSAAECLARIKAVLRRVDRPMTADIIRTGGLEFDVRACAVKFNGNSVPLTAKELGLLLAFLRNPDRVLDRPFLIDRVWGYNYFGSPRTVDVHVRRLRGKLGDFGGRIVTVSCAGYKLMSPRAGTGE